jgi:TfoX/Sxy family transcriptional regulator of competence genes
MAYDESLAERVREVLAGRRGITEKKMFGGLCFLLHGNMLVGVSGKGGLLVRFSRDDHGRVMKMKHMRPMEFTKRTMQGYAYVDPKGLVSQKDLSAWVERCLEYVSTLPKKAQG